MKIQKQGIVKIGNHHFLFTWDCKCIPLLEARRLLNLYIAWVSCSVSYNQVIELENMLTSTVCDRFESEGIVCPLNLHKGLFTVGALDNIIDHNPSSTTAQGSFHGTGISEFQFPTTSNSGTSREPIVIDSKSTRKYSLPESYTIVPAITCQTNTLAVPEATPLHSYQGHIDQARMEELTWIDRGIELLTKSMFQKEDCISWAAFHASLEHNSRHNSVDLPALISLLPLFYEKAATLSMIKHGMNMQKR